MAKTTFTANQFSSVVDKLVDVSESFHSWIEQHNTKLDVESYASDWDQHIRVNLDPVVVMDAVIKADNMVSRICAIVQKVNSSMDGKNVKIAEEVVRRKLSELIEYLKGCIYPELEWRDYGWSDEGNGFGTSVDEFDDDEWA